MSKKEYQKKQQMEEKRKELIAQGLIKEEDMDDENLK